jgi:hypothetical protein
MNNRNDPTLIKLFRSISKWPLKQMKLMTHSTDEVDYLGVEKNLKYTAMIRESWW